MIMVDHVEGQGDHTQSAIGQRRQGEGGLKRALTQKLQLELMDQAIEVLNMDKRGS
ncbi:hypothetical protein MGG_17367 [Pyricularia oryzae 70-15]|uniref:Uncharacterized protein n=3 Tax=Pyricularia oryzae TaxID=318829 RepID=G4NEC8_PYRO7|nr:uncharacterized protein MGG_17367 [Pyricularia oryzae 70-15]EHA48611.1 hypothetical protein MGG_17367 [Pyricularia oryzae 70-15]ELQ43429.1 hypothetical protein OOU_Y34scaffold00153g23 [Pyricularia oryzae Y34]